MPNNPKEAKRKTKQRPSITVLNLHEYKEENYKLVHIPTSEIMDDRRLWDEFATALNDKYDLENPYTKSPWNKNSYFSKFYGCDIKFNHKDCSSIILLFINNLVWSTNEIVINNHSPTNQILMDYFNISEPTIQRCLHELELNKVIARVGKNQNRKIFFNPKYAFNGVMILKSTLELFN
jgi:hypothetical protein